MIAMQEFTLFLLQAVLDFLICEPVIYLVAVVIMLFLCKIIKALIC